MVRRRQPVKPGAADAASRVGSISGALPSSKVLMQVIGAMPYQDQL